MYNRQTPLSSKQYLDICKIKCVYKKPVNDNSDHFLEQKEYELIATRAILRYTRNPIQSQLLHDQEAIANVVASLMFADWKYDPKHGRTRYSWRNQCVIWDIQKYCRRLSSYNNALHGKSMWDLPTCIEQKEQGNVDAISAVKNILLELNEFEKDIIKSYFLDLEKVGSISKRLNICESTIRHQISQIKEKIKNITLTFKEVSPNANMCDIIDAWK